MNTLHDWGPTIVSALFAVFSAGMLYSKVGDHDKKLVEHQDVLKVHEVKLESLAISAARAEGFAQGFSANKSGG